MKYLIFLRIICSMVLPPLIDVFKESNISFLITISDGVDFLYNRFNINYIFGSIGYFVIGFWLSERKPITGRLKTMLIPLAILLGGVSGAVSSIVSYSRGSLYWCFMHYNKVNVLLYSCILFLIFKEYGYNKSHNIIIERVSKLTYGVYLVHSYIMGRYLPMNWGLSAMSFNLIISIPIVVIITYCLSLGISFLISKIPILRDYMI